MKIIDEIIEEPIGGAHRNKKEVIFFTKKALLKYLKEYENSTGDEILEQRKEKFLSIGKQKSFNIFSNESFQIKKDNFLSSVKNVLFKFKKELIIVIFLIFIIFLFVI